MANDTNLREGGTDMTQRETIDDMMNRIAEIQRLLSAYKEVCPPGPSNQQRILSSAGATRQNLARPIRKDIEQPLAMQSECHQNEQIENYEKGRRNTFREISSKFDTFMSEFMGELGTFMQSSGRPNAANYTTPTDSVKLPGDVVRNSQRSCGQNFARITNTSNERSGVSDVDNCHNERHVYQLEPGSHPPPTPRNGSHLDSEANMSDTRQYKQICVQSDLKQMCATSMQRFAKDPVAIERGFCHVRVEDYTLDTRESIVVSLSPARTTKIDRYEQKVSPGPVNGVESVAWQQLNLPRNRRLHLSSQNHHQDTAEGLFSTRDTENHLTAAYTIGDLTAFDEYNDGFLGCGDTTRQAFTGSVPGVTEPYVYCSEGPGSRAMMHIEDLSLASVNMMLWGCPKVWLIIKPESTTKFEAFTRELYSKNGTAVSNCSQFVRHLNCIFTRQRLDEAGIRYTIIGCKAGELILTLPGVYHQVFNTGPNVAEAVNLAWRGIDLQFPSSIFCNIQLGCTPNVVSESLQRHHLRCNDQTTRVLQSQHSMTTRNRSSPRPITKEANTQPIDETPSRTLRSLNTKNNKRSRTSECPTTSSKRHKDEGKPATMSKEAHIPKDMSQNVTKQSARDGKVENVGSLQTRNLKPGIGSVRQQADETIEKTGARTCLTLLKGFRYSLGVSGSSVFTPQKEGMPPDQYRRAVADKISSDSEQQILSIFLMRLGKVLLNKSTSPQGGKMRRDPSAIDKVVEAMYPQAEGRSAAAAATIENQVTLPEQISTAPAKSARSKAKAYIYNGGHIHAAVGDDLGYLACLSPKANINTAAMASDNYIIMSENKLSEPLKAFGVPFVGIAQGHSEVVFHFDQMVLEDPSLISNIDQMSQEMMLRAINPSVVTWTQVPSDERLMAPVAVPCSLCGQPGFCLCLQKLQKQPHEAIRICIAQNSLELRAVRPMPSINSTGLGISLSEGEYISLLPGRIARTGAANLHQLESGHLKVKLSSDYVVFVDKEQFFMKVLLRTKASGYDPNIGIEIRVISGTMRAVLFALKAIHTGETLHPPAEFHEFMGEASI